MGIFQGFVDLFLHLDQQLAAAVSAYGPYIYAMLFVVIFCETGLVVTPFLPGDSLLFASGALAAVGALNIWILLGVFLSAAIIGDTVNYLIGREFGQRIIASGKVRALKPQYLEQTQAFFERHGGKTIILARFFPIIRTFAPFMAGVGKMEIGRFWVFNITGATLWVGLFLGAGYLFGNIPIVKDNLTIGILVMVAVSFLPSIYHVLKSRYGQSSPEPALASDSDPDTKGQ